MEYFNDFKAFLPLIPLLLIGLIAGLVNVFNLEAQSRTREAIVKNMITSSFLCALTFTILEATDLPYLARVGISASIAYFGIDKAIEIVQKLLSMKNNNKEKQ